MRRFTGTVAWFNDPKGFGFIVIEGKPGLLDVFAHYTDIEDEGFKSLAEGQRVSFEIDGVTFDRPRAVKIRKEVA